MSHTWPKIIADCHIIYCKNTSNLYRVWLRHEDRLIIKMSCYKYSIPNIKRRRPHDSLVYIIRIAIPQKPMLHWERPIATSVMKSSTNSLTTLKFMKCLSSEIWIASVHLSLEYNGLLQCIVYWYHCSEHVCRALYICLYFIFCIHIRRKTEHMENKSMRESSFIQQYYAVI